MSDATWDLRCPAPLEHDQRVLLAHGEGGRLMRKLIRDQVAARFANPYLERLEDAASLPACSGRMAVTTDSFVVSPLFFPGGDIGTLAVNGTVNDLVAAGARPLWLTLALILEEGLPMAIVTRVLDSVAAAAKRADVQIIAGDTKVVPRGAADRMFLTAGGVGEIVEPAPLGPQALQVGDSILVSGPLADHGTAVLVAREEMPFDPPPASDCAPLVEILLQFHAHHIPIRAMRDATRGGLAAVMHEWALASGHTFLLYEDQLPLRETTRGICELLGLDPLFVANEGVMVIGVPSQFEETALKALHELPIAQHATCVGHVVESGIAPVVIRRGIGGDVAVDEPPGAPLPRIC